MAAPAARPRTVVEDLTITLTAQAQVPGTLKMAPPPQRLYINNRFVRLSQDGSEFIIDSVSGRMTVVDLEAKTYSETSFDELAAHTNSLMPTNRFVRWIMARTFANMTVENGSDRRSVAGFDCEHYLLRVGPGTYQVWATTAIRPPDAYYDVMERAHAASSPFGNPMTPIYAHLRRVGAMPIEIDMVTQKVGVLDVLRGILDTVGGAMAVARAAVVNDAVAVAIAEAANQPSRVELQEQTETLSEILEVSRAPLPPATFELPAGLTKIPSPFAASR